MFAGKDDVHIKMQPLKTRSYLSFNFEIIEIRGMMHLAEDGYSFNYPLVKFYCIYE